MNRDQNKERQPMNPEQFRSSALARLCIGFAACIVIGFFHFVFSIHDGIRLLTLALVLHFSLVYSYQASDDHVAQKLYLWTAIALAAFAAFLALRITSLPFAVFIAVGGYAVYCYLFACLDKKDEKWYNYACAASFMASGVAFMHFLFYDVFFYASQGVEATQRLGLETIY